MAKPSYYEINGKEFGTRIESRVLEEKIQAAVADGQRWLSITAFGQHGIGGRLGIIYRPGVKLDSQSAHRRPHQRTLTVGRVIPVGLPVGGGNDMIDVMHFKPIHTQDSFEGIKRIAVGLAG